MKTMPLAKADVLGPSPEYLERQGKPPQEVYLDTKEGEATSTTTADIDQELAPIAGGQIAPESFEDTDEIKRARDRHPATLDVETALALYEQNCLARKYLQWPGQERWAKEYEAPRMGRILHMYDFVKALAGVGVDVRLNEYGRLGRIGVNAVVCKGCSQGPNAPCPDNCTGRDYTPVLTPSSLVYTLQYGPRKLEWKTITTVHNGMSPEYSVMRFDRFGTPTNEKYHGWRTALLVLIKAGVVSKNQALKAFGLATGEVAEFYLQQVAEVTHP